MSFRFHTTYPYIYVPIHRSKKERALKCQCFVLSTFYIIGYIAQIIIKILHLCGRPAWNLDHQMVLPLLKFWFLLQLLGYSCTLYLVIYMVHQVSTEKRDAKYLRQMFFHFLPFHVSSFFHGLCASTLNSQRLELHPQSLGEIPPPQ